MDNLRALAMLSGLVFHAALAYSPLAHPYFPTADRSTSSAIDAVIWLLHLMRMPLFFVVAGFFAALLVQRRGLGGLFRNRLLRIALPLVIFLPIVHSALSYSTAQAALHARHPSPVLEMIRPYLQMANPPMPPPTTGHLWFLYYLMLFYVLVWVARSLDLGKIGVRLRDLAPAWQLGLLPVLLVPALASVSAPHPAPESLLPQFWAFGFYGPFFVFGYLLFGHEDWLDRLRPFLPALLAAGAVLYGVFSYLVQHQTQANATWLLAVLEAGISTWLTMACLLLGRRWLGRSRSLLSYLSQASYWTYLVHLPILFAIQYRLMDLDWSWPLKLATSLFATFAICLASYQLLVRHTPLGKLLGSLAPPPQAGVTLAG